MNDVPASELPARLRSKMQPLADAFTEKHKCRDGAPYAGLECLAALARESSPDVQGRVAFRLRELVRNGNATKMTPLSRKALIFAMLSVQESVISEVQKNIVDAWYDLCMDTSTFERSDKFSGMTTNQKN